MKLDLEMLGDFACGLARSEVIDGGWRAQRLPTDMQPIFQETEAFQIRMNCPSAVRLRFVSNTRSLRLGLRFGAAPRQVFQGALIVDADEPQPFGPGEAQPQWSGTIFEQAEATQRTFDLWLPHLAATDITNFEIDDDASITPAPQLPLRWLVYGDSITQGMTSSLPTHSLVGRCARSLDAEAWNLAIGGAIMDARYPACVPDFPSDLVSIAYGTNDFNGGLSVDVYKANATQLIDALLEKQPERPIVMLTVVTWADRTTPNEKGVYLQDFRDAATRVAEAYKQVRVVPGETLIPDNAVLFEDNVHQNDAGFEHYARNLLPHLQQAVGAQIG